MSNSSLVKVDLNEFNRFCEVFEERLRYQTKLILEADKECRAFYKRTKQRTWLQRLLYCSSPYKSSYDTIYKVLVRHQYLKKEEISLVYTESPIFTNSDSEDYTRYLKGLNDYCTEELFLSTEAFRIYTRLKSLE